MVDVLMVPPLSAGWGSSGVRNRTRIGSSGPRPGDGEGAAALAGPLLAQNQGHGLKQYPEVARDRVVAYVLQVVSDFLVVGEVGATVHLGEAGHARPHLVALMEVGRPVGHDLRHVRPGSHQAHVSPDYVEELRELIDGGLTEHRSDLGDGGVAPAGAEEGLRQVTLGNSIGDAA